MSSKTRTMMRSIAHAEMKAEGIQRPNRRYGGRKRFISKPKRKEIKGNTPRSFFAHNWKAYFIAATRRKRKGGVKR